MPVFNTNVYLCVAANRVEKILQVLRVASAAARFSDEFSGRVKSRTAAVVD